MIPKLEKPGLSERAFAVSKESKQLSKFSGNQISKCSKNCSCLSCKTNQTVAIQRPKIVNDVTGISGTIQVGKVYEDFPEEDPFKTKEKSADEKIYLIHDASLYEIALKIKKFLIEKKTSLSIVQAEESEAPNFSEVKSVILLKRDPFKDSAFSQKFKELRASFLGNLVLAAIEQTVKEIADYKKKLDLGGYVNQPAIIVEHHLRKMNEPILPEDKLLQMVEKISKVIS